MAAYGEIDDVIDPADSARWIATLFDAHAEPWWKRSGKTPPLRRRLVSAGQPLAGAHADASPCGPPQRLYHRRQGRHRAVTRSGPEEGKAPNIFSRAGIRKELDRNR